MNRLCRFGLLCLIPAVLLSACGGGDADTPLAFDPFADQYDASAYNIGIFPLYPYRLNANLLAAQQVNASGGLLNGRRLNLVAASFQTVDAFETIDIEGTARRMLEDYGFSTLVTGSSYVLLKLAELTVPAGAVLLGDSATSPSITALDDRDLVFRVPPSDAIAGQVLAELAWNDGARRCASVYTADDAYGAGLSAAFKQAFVALGGEVVSETALPKELSNDFVSYFPAIFGAQPDCVFPPLLRSTTAANLVNEATTTQFNGFYLFSDAAFAEGFTTSIANPDSLRGSIAVTPGFGLRGSPEFEQFVANYRAQYAQEPLNYTVHAYDLMMVLALAIERAGREFQTDNPDGLMIRDSLRAVMNPPGTRIGPSQIAEGLALLRAGQEVDFFGASNLAMSWDANGDIAGQPVYDVYRYSEAARGLALTTQVSIELPLE